MDLGRGTNKPNGTPRYVSALMALALLAVQGASVQPARAGEDRWPVTPELQAAIVDSVTSVLNEHYVFEDVATDMERLVRDRLGAGAYDEHETIADFVVALEADLHAVSRNQHLTIRYASHEDIRWSSRKNENAIAEEGREFQNRSRQNFYFEEVRVLPGNIGYLKLDRFLDTALAGPTASAALGFLAHADAIIIDLRENDGGTASLVQYMAAYFLEEPVLLCNVYSPRSGTVEQEWSSPYVPGLKMESVDLYILTSPHTLCAGELFTYSLQNLGRATVVGENTRGGAHEIFFRVFPSLNCRMTVPHRRMVSPVTGTNWEGTGVDPDIRVPAYDALDRAYFEALTRLRAEVKDGVRIARLEWAIDGLRAKLDRVEIDVGTLEPYVGRYGPRVLRVEGGSLLYQREGGPVCIAVPMGKTLFRFEELDYFRLEVVLDEEGLPLKLVGHYEDGQSDESPRSED